MPEKIPFKEYQTRLAGTWELYLYLQYKDGQVVGKPHGEHPLGIAQISAEGYSSSHLADPNRLNIPRSDRAWSAHSDTEIAHYSRGMSMYCGQIELFKDDQGLFWKTKVDIASDPSRIGGEQVRRVVLGEEDGRHFMTLQPLNADANMVCVYLKSGLFGMLTNMIAEWGVINTQMAQVSTSMRHLPALDDSVVNELMREDMVDLGYLKEDTGVENIHRRWRWLKKC